MKKSILITAACILAATTFAQYKKASFFNKDGKVYELGVIKSFFPDAAGKQPLSIVYSNSVENGQKKFSGYQEIEVMLKSNFSYNSSYYSPAQNQNVTGKITATRSGALIIKYGGQYRFINTEKEDLKLEPYIRLGLIYGLNFGGKNPVDKNNQPVSPDVYPTETESILGIEAGGGVSYFFTKKFGVRAGGFFRLSSNVEAAISGDNAGTYNSFKAHPGITLSLKYKIFSEE